MRRLHLIVSILTLMAFVITGQIMRLHAPPLHDLTADLRLLYRSRHIYILASGLVNLILGLYFQRNRPGWPTVVQTIGSMLVLVAPVLLIVAFATEPGRGFSADLHWGAAGVQVLFAGCVLHGAARAGARYK
jgi:hypothetical protein